MRSKLIILLTMAIMAAGCSAEKRAQRHLRKAIALDPRILTDRDTVRTTVIEYDTIIVPEISVDTTFILQPTDTFTVYQDRIQVRIVRVNDTVFTADIDVPVDTVIRKDTVLVEIETPPRILYRVRKRDIIPWVFLGIGIGCIVGIAVIGLLQRRRD